MYLNKMVALWLSKSLPHFWLADGQEVCVASCLYWYWQEMTISSRLYTGIIPPMYWQGWKNMLVPQHVGGTMKYFFFKYVNQKNANLFKIYFNLTFTIYIKWFCDLSNCNLFVICLNCQMLCSEMFVVNKISVFNKF